MLLFILCHLILRGSYLVEEIHHAPKIPDTRFHFIFKRWSSIANILVTYTENIFADSLTWLSWLEIIWSLTYGSAGSNLSGSQNMSSVPVTSRCRIGQIQWQLKQIKNRRRITFLPSGRNSSCCQELGARNSEGFWEVALMDDSFTILHNRLQFFPLVFDGVEGA